MVQVKGTECFTMIASISRCGFILAVILPSLLLFLDSRIVTIWARLERIPFWRQH